MSANLVKKEGDIWHLEVSGVLQKSEVDAIQSESAKEFQSGGTISLLISLDNFEGWEKGADWNDMSFLLEHGDSITKMALVGDPKWETETLAFVGAGYRSTEIKYFPPAERDQATAWLAGG